ncbi:MAG TPA: DUF5995 family protein [Nakamurella sp.]
MISRMRLIADSLPEDDGVRAFTTVYQRVTEAIRDRLGTGFFADDRFVEILDVVFAGRFLAAVDSSIDSSIDTAPTGHPVNRAWRPLFVARADPRIHAVQFVVAGMNAHINFDLSLAVVDACTAEHVDPDTGSVAEDYDRVNDVLESIESAVRNSLLHDLELQLGQPLEPLVHLISSWSIANAREAAWVRAKVLWQLRHIGPLFDQAVDISASAVGMTSRQLLTPLLE